MLEVLEINQKQNSHFEKDKDGVIFVSEKINPQELALFAHAYYGEKCYFKKNNKIEIVKVTKKQLKATENVMNLGHHCNQEPCPGLLRILSEIFETDIAFKRDTQLAHIIQSNKIYPVLLVCLKQILTNTPLYFTTFAINTFGESYEKSN